LHPPYHIQPTTPPTPTLSLHDALPISKESHPVLAPRVISAARKSRRDGRSHGRGFSSHQGERGQNSDRERKRYLLVVHRDKPSRSEEHTCELQSPDHLVCRLLLEKKRG